MTETLSQTLTAHKAWLDRQPLAAKTRMAYRLQVHQYGVSLALRSPTADDPLYTPFGLGECVALNLDDLRISARQGTVIMRSGKGDTYREVPLNAQVRKALKTWLKERNTRFPQTSDMAVFLNRSGKRLTVTSLTRSFAASELTLIWNLSPRLAPYMPDQSRPLTTHLCSIECVSEQKEPGSCEKHQR